MRVRVFVLILFAIGLSPCLSGQTSTSRSAALPEEFDWDHEIAVGDDAYNDGNFVEAEQHYRESLAIAERLHLSEAQRATSLASVAQSMRYEKKFKEAEPFFREALTIREKVLPANHPRMASTLEGLGASVFAQDRLNEAEGYFLRALAIRDRLTALRARMARFFNCWAGPIFAETSQKRHKPCTNVHFRPGSPQKKSAL